jgi:hypothetical protein
VSQEERDARLGLTGLTPEQRQKRVEELERELAEKQRVARAKLEATRAARLRNKNSDTTSPNVTDPAG